MEQNFDRHFYLYAKGHYKRNEENGIIADLKKLVALRCGLDEKYVSKKDIISVLSFIQPNKINIDTFISKLLDLEMFYSDYPFEGKLIKALLYFLQFADVKDIPFKLGEADSKILPLRSDN